MDNTTMARAAAEIIGGAALTGFGGIMWWDTITAVGIYGAHISLAAAVAGSIFATIGVYLAGNGIMRVTGR